MIKLNILPLLVFVFGRLALADPNCLKDAFIPKRASDSLEFGCPEGCDQGFIENMDMEDIFTIMFWVKPGNTPDDSPCINFRNSYTRNLISIFINDGEIEVQRLGQEFIATTGLGLREDRWYHIAIVHGDQQLNSRIPEVVRVGVVYVDGRPMDVTVLSDNHIPRPTDGATPPKHHLTHIKMQHLPIANLGFFWKVAFQRDDMQYFANPQHTHSLDEHDDGAHGSHVSGGSELFMAYNREASQFVLKQLKFPHVESFTGIVSVEEGSGHETVKICLIPEFPKSFTSHISATIQQKNYTIEIREVYSYKHNLILISDGATNTIRTVVDPKCNSTLMVTPEGNCSVSGGTGKFGVSPGTIHIRSGREALELVPPQDYNYTGPSVVKGIDCDSWTMTQSYSRGPGSTMEFTLTWYWALSTWSVGQSLEHGWRQPIRIHLEGTHSENGEENQFVHYYDFNEFIPGEPLPKAYETVIPDGCESTCVLDRVTSLAEMSLPERDRDGSGRGDLLALMFFLGLIFGTTIFWAICAKCFDVQFYCPCSDNERRQPSMMRLEDTA